MITRRNFISGLLAAGGLGIAEKLGATNAINAVDDITAKIDDDLVVFISDLHVNPEGYQPEMLRKVVNNILKLKRLPKNIVEFGDLAYLTGRVEEYKKAKEILSPLKKNGIKLTLGMGNHDRREEFAEVFPEYASQSLFKDRYTFVVKGKYADIIMLDSLQQGDDKTTWITPGALNDKQKDWLNETLKSTTKPTFVTSHHPIHEVGIAQIILSNQSCCGYIHGHDHRWYKNWIHSDYKSKRLIRTLCLPSTGHWGDIGFTTFSMTKDKAVATLHQNDFFFPKPLENGAEKPAEWKAIIEENKGETCTFMY